MPCQSFNDYMKAYVSACKRIELGSDGRQES